MQNLKRARLLLIQSSTIRAIQRGGKERDPFCSKRALFKINATIYIFHTPKYLVDYNNTSLCARAGASSRNYRDGLCRAMAKRNNNKEMQINIFIIKNKIILTLRNGIFNYYRNTNQ